MNGYSKIRVLSTNKSRSVGLSDPFPPSASPKPITDLFPKIQETNQTSNLKANNPNTPKKPFPEQEHEDGAGETFGAILNRSYSVSAASRKFRREEKNSSVQSAVKRAFSLRRSSSVSERYTRIHDQSSPIHSLVDDDNVMTTMKKTRSKKTRGKILKACKKLFGH